MNKILRIAVYGLLGVAVLFPALVRGEPSAAEAAAAPAPARQKELLNLVRQDCGSCHGLRLEGGLGLPLTPQALQEKSPDALKETILYGRAGTPMPPWKPFLTDAEAGWIVQMLLKGLP